MTVAVEVTDTTLPALMERIESGDQIQLMKNGIPFARLVPQQTTSMVFTETQRERARQALMDMNTLRNELNLGPFNFEEFQADRDNGRR